MFLRKKVSFFYPIIYQQFIYTFSQKDDTLILFHKKQKAEM